MSCERAAASGTGAIVSITIPPLPEAYSINRLLCGLLVLVLLYARLAHLYTDVPFFYILEQKVGCAFVAAMIVSIHGFIAMIVKQYF